MIRAKFSQSTTFYASLIRARSPAVERTADRRFSVLEPLHPGLKRVESKHVWTVAAQYCLRRELRLDQASSSNVGRSFVHEQNVVPSDVGLVVELPRRNVQVFDAAAALRKIDGKEGGYSVAHIVS